jgi:hypothetical protein
VSFLILLIFLSKFKLGAMPTSFRVGMFLFNPAYDKRKQATHLLVFHKSKGKSHSDRSEESLCDQEYKKPVAVLRVTTFNQTGYIVQNPSPL